MESKRSPRILSRLSKSSSKSSTLSKDFKNKNNASSSLSADDSLKSSKVSLSFKELKKQQDQKKKLEQQQFKIQQQQLKNENKLQQKQLKIQQKKNEKEKKSNTLKVAKNKSVSETSNLNNASGETANPSTDVALVVDDEKRFSDGVKFKGKLVGIEPVLAARGDKMCQNALKNLRLIRRSTSSHKQRIIININLNGVQLLDQKTNDLVANHVINLISYITRDITDNRTFGYVYGTPESGHQFIAIKSEKVSMYVMNAIGELFTYVYNKKKKEKERQEIETRNFDQSITDNSQSSHTLVDDKQPQNQGFNNETLMEFLKQQQDKIQHQQSYNSQTLPTASTTYSQEDYKKDNSYGFNDTVENRYQSTSNTLHAQTLPPRAESNCSNYSNYSSNTNLNSYYGSSSHFRSTTATNNCQSELSLATQGSCSEMQQMQNVISSAKKANDKFKGWLNFEDAANDEFGSNSLISEKDENEDSIADDNWASFSPPEPSYPPPSLNLSTEDLSINVDTNTLTNYGEGIVLDSSNNQINPTNQTNQEPNNLNSSLNSSKNSTAFVVKLDIPPASSRRRRSTRLSEGDGASSTTDNTNRDKQAVVPYNLNEIKRKQTTNQFESNFNQTTSGFFDFDKMNNEKTSREFNSFEITKDNSSRNDSRNSNHAQFDSFNRFDKSFDNKFDKSFDTKFDNKFDKNFGNLPIDKKFDSFKKFDSSTSYQHPSNMQLITNNSTLNSFDTVNSDTVNSDSNISNENNSMDISANYSKLFNQTPSNQYSSIDSAVSMSQNNTVNSSSQLNQVSFNSSMSDKKSSSLDINEFNQIDPNDKYAVFNDINSMKLSIFSTTDPSHNLTTAHNVTASTKALIETKKEDDKIFLSNKGNKQPQPNHQITTSSCSLNKSQNLQSFEDSFLANSSLNQSKTSSFNSHKSVRQLDQSISQQKDNLANSSNSSSIYSSAAITDPELIDCHLKFLRERQEKLDQIDKIFEEEKVKIRARQRELNAQHLKQQKNLLNQQKSYQQEFYQRQKHQRQTILHQLQLQRLPVAQFDQCKLQLQQKLKNDQKQLQSEFIKKQQELKKQQIDEQNQITQQYKVLEEQYLEKQSELLNSDFEIEIDLPDVPNIFDNDDSLYEQAALTKRFELSLKNEFDKLTNEIIQTTSSSLNSSPKMSERCSTACSIASSSSRHNPFIGDDRSEKLFEDFDKALKLLDNTPQSDFYSFGSKGSSKEQSLDYSKNDLNKSLNNDSISSACSSLETNRSTLPGIFNSTLQYKSTDNSTLNKSLNENFKKPTLNQLYRSQQQLSDSFGSQFGTYQTSTIPHQQQRSLFNQPSVLPQQQGFDPFNSSFVETKLNEMNRIKELRQHTQQNLVSFTLPERSTIMDSTFNQSAINQSATNRPAINQSITNQTPISQTSINQTSISQTPISQRKEEDKQKTSIHELEDLLGLSTSRSSKNPLNFVSNNTGLNNNSSSLNTSLNESPLNINQQFKTTSTNSSKATNTLNSKMFDNLFDLKKNSSLANLFVNDNSKKSSLSFQDLRSDQFMNSLSQRTKDTQNLLPSLEQKNSMDVFGTVVVGDLNNKSTANQLLKHFGTENLIPQERNIFSTNKDPFKEDDFFNS